MFATHCLQTRGGRGLAAFIQRSRLLSTPATKPVIAVSRPADGVAHVELARPEKHNAMNSEFWEQCKKTFDSLSHNGTVRAIVLSGQGESFSAGIDLSTLQQAEPLHCKEDAARISLMWQEYVKPLQDAFNAIEQCQKPVIAALHGYCYGAGVDMISATDIRYACEDLKMSIMEVNLGIAADLGTLQRLPYLCNNISSLRELIYTGRIFDAKEAEHLGIVSSGKVYSTKQDMIEGAMKTATEIASKSPTAVVTSKASLNYSRDHSIQDGLNHIALANGAMLQSSDIPACMIANQKKMKPVFRDLGRV
eukprot:m.212760 g.212760  ORF g.212760 m.212760 type:complete len:307 (+) comp15857_c0_seq8:74-994(+)